MNSFQRHGGIPPNFTIFPPTQHIIPPNQKIHTKKPPKNQLSDSLTTIIDKIRVVPVTDAVSPTRSPCGCYGCWDFVVVAAAGLVGFGGAD